MTNSTIVLTYWTTGAYRCVLCDDDQGLFVKVLSDSGPLFLESCTDPEDGAKRAEALFAIFDAVAGT